MERKKRGNFVSHLGSMVDINELLSNVEIAQEKAKQSLIEAAIAQGDRGVAQAQGFFAEHWHAKTFNLDAMLNRKDDLDAVVLNSNELNSPDILIVNNEGDIISEYSSKYYKTGKDTVNAQKGYQDQERLIPKDQMEDGREYINRQTAKDLSGGKENRINNVDELNSINEKLTDKVKKDGVESDSISRKENEDVFKNSKEGKGPEFEPQIDSNVLINEAMRSGAIAAGIHLGMELAPKIYNSIVFRSKNGEWPQENFKEALKGAVPSALEAGLRGSVATTTTLAAKSGALGSAMQGADPLLIGTLTFLIWETSKDFIDYKNGKNGMEGQDFANKVMAKSVAATSGAYGAAIGQVAIPIPIVGAMVGAMVGSFFGGKGYESLDYVSEKFYRTKEFEEMKMLTNQLARNWESFTNTYEIWNEVNQSYKNEMIKWAERNRSLNQESLELNGKLNAALNEDILGEKK